jgi:hypothetical protein
MRHEQFEYLKKMLQKEFDSLKFGAGSTEPVFTALDLTDNEGVVDVEEFINYLQSIKNAIDLTFHVLAQESQSQNKLHNDKITNPRTGEKY